MGTNLKFSLAGPLSQRVLITCIILALAVGYSISLLQVRNRGSFNLKETVRHFRGAESSSPEGEGIYVPQSDTALISVAHVHTFSQPIVLSVMGFLFLLTSLSEGVKVFWILLSFFGSFAMNLSPWLIRDVSPGFVCLLYVGGTAMIASFCVMAVKVLYETWWGKISIETEK